MKISDAIQKTFAEALLIRSDKEMNTSHTQMKVLLTAATFDKVEIFRSYNDHPVGYVLYANVSADSLHMLKNYAEIPYFNYEWESGKIVFLFDMVFIDGYKSMAKRELRKFLKKQRCYAYKKRGELFLRRKKFKL